MIKFSVIIPCFNAIDTLAETLASISAQTFGDFEVLCVDDGSTDDTRAMIRSAAEADPRIQLLRNMDKGPSSARNTGIAAANGEIIAFCDADDLWAPEKLAVLAQEFNTRNVDGLFGRIAFFAETPRASDVLSTVPTGALTIPALLGENPVCTMSNIAVRTPCLRRIAKFDPSVVHNEDLEWLIRLVGGGADIRGIDQTLVWYRATPTGLSADLDAMAKGRAFAVNTARSFGYAPCPKAEAIHFRYLARRALRLDLQGATALKYCLRGLRQSPTGFLFPTRRGVATVVASVVAPMCPRSVRRAVFAA